MSSGTYKVECLRHLFLIADALVAHLEVVDLGYCQGQAEAWITALDGAKSVDFFLLASQFLFHVHLELALGEKVSVKFIPCRLERMDSEDEKDSSDWLVKPGVKFNSESEDKIDCLVIHLEWLVFPDTSCQGSVNNHL